MADFDIVIIGGGVNGAGIARDAAGRGLSVLLLEKNDLASGTSSGSTKLFHGGLRYLEYYEFKLVRQALKEREVLWKNMPHISWPMRFILPHHSGLRPKWLIRLGLFLYDHIGGRKKLPASRGVRLQNGPLGEPLKDNYDIAYEYSDLWVDDARLVALNARDAAERGAIIKTRAECTWLDYQNGSWEIEYKENGKKKRVSATLAVNAAGPWLEHVLQAADDRQGLYKLRLVRGSHIVTKKLFRHNQPYIFQQTDGRIIFAIPYRDQYTLIGTTDADHQGSPDKVEPSSEEIDYLCKAVGEYLKKEITPNDVVYKYAAVRPLLDDGKNSAAAATRDYIVRWQGDGSRGPLLNIFGGKITTFRSLAEKASNKLVEYFPNAGSNWTHAAPLPGGDFKAEDFDSLTEQLRLRFPFLTKAWAKRLMQAYGTDASIILADAKEKSDLGQDFGGTLTAFEVQWLMQHEFAKTAEDVVWRRSKCGMEMTKAQIKELDRWMKSVA